MIIKVMNIVAQIWWVAGDSKLKQPVPTETPSWLLSCCRKYTQNTNPTDTNISLKCKREQISEMNVALEGHGCSLHMFVYLLLFFASGTLQHSYIIKGHCCYHTFHILLFPHLVFCCSFNHFVCLFVAWPVLAGKVQVIFLMSGNCKGGSYRQAPAFFLFLFLDCMHQVLHFASHTTALHFNITS